MILLIYALKNNAINHPDGCVKYVKTYKYTKSDKMTSCHIINVEDLQDYFKNHIYCKYMESIKYYEKN